MRCVAARLFGSKTRSASSMSTLPTAFAIGMTPPSGIVGPPRRRGGESETYLPPRTDARRTSVLVPAGSGPASASSCSSSRVNGGREPRGGCGTIFRT